MQLSIFKRIKRACYKFPVVSKHTYALDDFKGGAEKFRTPFGIFIMPLPSMF